jgi:hypothetical protein
VSAVAPVGVVGGTADVGCLRVTLERSENFLTCHAPGFSKHASASESFVPLYCFMQQGSISYVYDVFLIVQGRELKDMHSI